MRKESKYEKLRRELRLPSSSTKPLQELDKELQLLLFPEHDGEQPLRLDELEQVNSQVLKRIHEAAKQPLGLRERISVLRDWLRTTDSLTVKIFIHALIGILLAALVLLGYLFGKKVVAESFAPASLLLLLLTRR